MAAGIAHEVRNPLTAVKGFLQLMDQSSKNEYSQIAQSELDRAIHILNDLMSVSKPEFAQETPTTFNIMLRNRIDFALISKSALSLTWLNILKMKIHLLLAEKIKLRKHCSTLLKNAMEAMSESGTLAIEQY